MITKRRQAAQIRGKPIYAISGVTLIPLSSFSEAKTVIETSHKALEPCQGTQGGAAADDDTSDEEIDHAEHADATAGAEDEPSSPINRKISTTSTTSKDGSSVVQDVIGKKGAYGRFAERWFSKKGWSVERRKSQGMSSDISRAIEAQEAAKESPGETQGVEKSTAGSTEDGAGEEDKAPSVVSSLVPKLLRTTRLLLNSQSFYFSYDHDITHRTGAEPGRSGEVPLHRLADPLVGVIQQINFTDANFGLLVLLEPLFDLIICAERSRPICPPGNARFR